MLNTSQNQNPRQVVETGRKYRQMIGDGLGCGYKTPESSFAFMVHNEN